MLAGLAFGSEIKRFGRSRMTRAAIVVLMLLPLVYGALYLWAYWDPFGHVNKMPVALVNADKGATVSGQQVNIGEEISKSLTADGSMDWHVLNLDEARAGVDHGKYYFMLELPPDFSEAIASPLTGQPKQANLVAVYNDANNYISSSIGRTAIDQVLNAVSTRISGQAVNQVLSVVVSSGAGIQQAADGAQKLADGAAKVDDGAGQLANGLHTARPGSAQLATGAKQTFVMMDLRTKKDQPKLVEQFKAAGANFKLANPKDAEAVIARYPQRRSALLPLLHLVQSIDGYVTGRGIDFCASTLGLTTAEVSGVATFYTQYKRHPNGDYTVGVCTNTLCAVMGGDAIWETVSEHLGIGHDETTEDGKITLERIECNAACDYAPVVMTNWEFFDNQTPDSTVQLVDDLRAGAPVAPTRGPSRVCTFKQVSRVLAGFPDGRADEGVGAGEGAGPRR